MLEEVCREESHGVKETITCHSQFLSRIQGKTDVHLSSSSDCLMHESMPKMFCLNILNICYGPCAFRSSVTPTCENGIKDIVWDPIEAWTITGDTRQCKLRKAGNHRRKLQIWKACQFGVESSASWGIHIIQNLNFVKNRNEPKPGWHPATVRMFPAWIITAIVIRCQT